MRVFFSVVLAGLAAVLVLLVAAGTLLAQTGAADALAGSEWRPVEIRGQPVDDRSAIYVRFGADGKVTGSGGCNRFFGERTLAGSSLTFSPLASTRKACPEPLMTMESRFLGTLEETRAFERDRARLVLRNAAGEPIMRLAQTDWD